MRMFRALCLALFFLCVPAIFAQNNTTAYQSGQTIKNPIATVKIDGWRIYIDHDEVREYILYHPGEGFTFQFIIPGGPDAVQKIGYPLDYSITRGPHCSINGKKFFVFVGHPPLASEYAYLHISRWLVNGHEELENAVYPVKFISYPNSPDVSKGESGKDAPYPFFAEEPLTQEQIDIIFRYHNLFTLVTRPAPDILVVSPITSDKPRNSVYYADSNIIFLDRQAITDEKFYHEFAITVFHENVHSFVERKVLGKLADIKFRIVLLHGYKRLIKDIGLDPNRLELIRLVDETKEYYLQRAFSSFDESSYIMGSAELHRFGHPYDNINEFLTSSFTIFYFFPDQFIARLSRLPVKQRRIAASVAYQLLWVLEQNISFLDRNIVLPKLGKLKKFCKRNK